VAAGSFKIWPVDRYNKLIGWPPSAGPSQGPATAAAAPPTAPPGQEKKDATVKTADPDAKGADLSTSDAGIQTPSPSAEVDRETAPPAADIAPKDAGAPSIPIAVPPVANVTIDLSPTPGDGLENEKSKGPISTSAPGAPVEVATAAGAPATKTDGLKVASAGADKPPPLTVDQSAATPNPSHPDAFDIYFGVLENVAETPPQNQVDLQDRLQKVLRTIQLLYGADKPTPRQQKQFRSYYVRVFRLAQLGLEGPNVAPDIATSALKNAVDDLIDDEAGIVKKAHLCALAVHAFQLSVPCLAGYFVLRSISAYAPCIDAFLLRMGIQSLLLSNFMMLLVGCFLGVCLSYGIRTTTFSLTDLTVTDSDRLTPLIRLIFAAALTMILGIVFALQLVEVTLAKVSVTSLTHEPMLAFLIGCFCGISELVLPSMVAKRASDFIANIK
jgi:hypothetical protein